MIRNKKQETINKMGGLTLVEVVIASAIILAAVLALLGVHSLYLKMALGNGDAIKAAYLSEEGLEAMRFLRDSSWSANVAPLSLGTEYGLILNGAVWEVSYTDTLVDEFERTVTLSAVYRDGNGDIVSSGGTLDANTLLVVSSVSWANAGATTTKSISTYLTNLLDN